MRKEKGGKRGKKKMGERQEEREKKGRELDEKTEEGTEETAECLQVTEEACKEDDRCEEDSESHSAAKTARVCATVLFGGFLWSLINVNIHLRTDNKIGLDTISIYSKTHRFHIKQSYIYIHILYVQYLIVGTLQIVEHTHISQLHSLTVKKLQLWSL